MADFDRRLELQTLFEGIVGKGHVYFQPGANIKMSYPAIVYSRDNMYIRSADNTNYAKNVMYKVTVIDPNPDSKFVEEISVLPTVRFNTHYTSDNLNHDVFTIY